MKRHKKRRKPVGRLARHGGQVVTTVSLSPWHLARLEQHAREHGTSTSGAVRQLVEAAYGAAPVEAVPA